MYKIENRSLGRTQINIIIKAKQTELDKIRTLELTSDQLKIKPDISSMINKANNQGNESFPQTLIC